MKRSFFAISVLVFLSALLLLPIKGHARAPEEVLVHATYGPTQTLDPANAQATHSSQMVQNIYNRLVYYGGPDATKVKPSLAKNWEISNDGKTYTYHLRKGVKFHNGNELTAEDVVYSFKRLLAIDRQGAIYIKRAGVTQKNVKKVDKYTVKIELGEKIPFHLKAMATKGGSILDKQWVEAHGGYEEGKLNEYITTHANGTGPYKLEKWRKRQRIVLTRFENYWRGWEGKHVDKVIYKLSPEFSTRLMELKRGDVDIAYVPSGQKQQVEGLSGVKVFNEGFDPYVLYVHMNNTKKYLSNNKVRKALAYSFPYEKVLNVAYKGTAVKAQGLIGQGVFGFPEEMKKEWYKQDLDKAAKLLKEAGYSNGLPESLTLWYDTGRTARKKLGLLWQQDLKKLGINLKVRKQDWPVIAQKVENGDYELYASGGWASYPDASSYVGMVMSKYKGISMNFSYFSNEKVDKYASQALHTLDSGKREELYLRISKILKKESPMIFVAQMKPLTVMRDWVKGYYYNPVTEIDYYSIYKEY